MKKSFLYILLISIPLLILACTKETVKISDNDAPLQDQVPTVKIENYINKLFIDLIGREPLNLEMEQEVLALRANDLDQSARLDLISKLQTNTDFIDGDTSYHKAYHQQLYNLAKVKLLEGASDEKIKEFMNGSTDEMNIERLNKVLSAKRESENGLITFDEMMGRMIHNLVYDAINMNSFNFVNASFDNLLWRFPTDAEFEASYTMVEFRESANLFGEVGTDKTAYVDILTSNKEMFEGIIIWTYQSLLARRPTSEETAKLLNDFYQHRDIKLIQQEIMVGNEYANFQ